MQFVLMLSMKYDVKHFFSPPLVVVERTICEHYKNREPFCAPQDVGSNCDDD